MLVVPVALGGLGLLMALVGLAVRVPVVLLVSVHSTSNTREYQRLPALPVVLLERTINATRLGRATTRTTSTTSAGNTTSTSGTTSTANGGSLASTASTYQ